MNFNYASTIRIFNIYPVFFRLNYLVLLQPSHKRATLGAAATSSCTLPEVSSNTCSSSAFDIMCRLGGLYAGRIAAKNFSQYLFSTRLSGAADAYTALAKCLVICS